MCGLRSKLRYDTLEEYAKKFDIVCLTETKTDLIEKQWFPTHSVVTMSKKCSSHVHGGIHGICILVSDEIMQNVDIVEGTSSSSILWIHIKNSSITENMVLGAVYLPCEASRHFSDDIFHNLMSDLSYIEGRYKAPILLTGDFNSRTGVLSDIITGHDSTGSDDDGVLNNVFDSVDHLQSLGIDIERYSQDTVCNKNGYQLIECCKTADLSANQRSLRFCSNSQETYHV